jgi:hypothetical protein
MRMKRPDKSGCAEAVVSVDKMRIIIRLPE